MQLLGRRIFKDLSSEGEHGPREKQTQGDNCRSDGDSSADQRYHSFLVQVREDLRDARIKQARSKEIGKRCLPWQVGCSVSRHTRVAEKSDP